MNYKLDYFSHIRALLLWKSEIPLQALNVCCFCYLLLVQLTKSVVLFSQLDEQEERLAHDATGVFFLNHLNFFVWLLLQDSAIYSTPFRS